MINIFFFLSESRDVYINVKREKYDYKLIIITFLIFPMWIIMDGFFLISKPPTIPIFEDF